MRRQVFVPNWGKNTAVFYVRTETPAPQGYSMLRDEVRRLDAAMPMYELKTLEGQLDETLLTDRLIAMLSAGFGFVAVFGRHQQHGHLPVRATELGVRAAHLGERARQRRVRVAQLTRHRLGCARQIGERDRPQRMPLGRHRLAAAAAAEGQREEGDRCQTPCICDTVSDTGPRRTPAHRPARSVAVPLPCCSVV